MPMIRRAWELLSCAARHWNADNASTTGAALAFFCAFSLAPLLVILLTIAGLVIDAEAAYGQVSVQLQGLFGPATAKVIMEAVGNAQQTQGLLATLLSIVTLIIGATTVLAALQTALATIWNTQALLPGGLWGWIRARLMSMGFILTLGFLLLVSLTITTGIATLRERFAERHKEMVVITAVVDALAAFVVVSLLFALIYRYMPAKRTPWKVVLIGGALTAILFNVGRWAVGLYLASSTQASAFGAAASFAALLLWLYYTAQIFLYGAELTACLAGARKDPPKVAEAKLPQRPAKGA